MFKRLSQRLQHPTSRPRSSLYGQLALALVLGMVLTGWLVYGKVSDQLDNLTQRPVFALEGASSKF